MKSLPILLLLLAGGVLGWIALRSPEPTHEAWALDEAPEPPHVPIAILAQPAADEVIVAVSVEGMCCTGCTGKLHERLLALPGVRAAAVDFDRGLAQALGPAELSSARLVETLTFDKYRARALE